ncbi:hypothetical protein CGRA01v4_00685 [Colletotrichum graminicola]|nr:hypothetical protein CGRA01v4_00685 [Colletotrichum graminicola]
MPKKDAVLQCWLPFTATLGFLCVTDNWVVLLEWHGFECSHPLETGGNASARSTRKQSGEDVVLGNPAQSLADWPQRFKEGVHVSNEQLFCPWNWPSSDKR